MASIHGHQMPTNSFHVIRAPIAILTVAPFSPDRDLKRLDYSTRHRSAKARWGSLIPRRDTGFESLEPTSPEVGCLGHIKLKHKSVEASKHRNEKKPGRTAKGKLSRLKKFIFGGCGEGGDTGPRSVACPTAEGCRAPYPTLGQLKRYASGSYGAEFGDIYARPKPFGVL